MGDRETIFILILTLSLIFLFGYEMGKQSGDYKLKEDLKECELEKEMLEIKTIEIKQDMAELLIDSYGKPIVWDIIGISKYKRGLCALKLILKNEIPLINELPC